MASDGVDELQSLPGKLSAFLTVLGERALKMTIQEFSYSLCHFYLDSGQPCLP